MTSATLPHGPLPTRPAEEAIQGRSLWADAWRRLLRNRAAVVTAALCLWNVGAAFVLGFGLHAGLKRGIVKL